MTLIMSLVGMVTLVAIALIFSYDRKSIRLRTVLGAFAIQAGIGAFVLYVPFGQAVLQTISAGVSQVLVFANDGIGFLFGGLADVENVGFVFAIKVLPVIIFFSSLIAVLYYLASCSGSFGFWAAHCKKHWAPRAPNRSLRPPISSWAKPSSACRTPIYCPHDAFAAICGDVWRLSLGSRFRSSRLRGAGYSDGVLGRGLLYGGAGRPAIR